VKYELTKYDMKKNKILEATFRCIYKKGIAEVSMRSIAKEAHLNQSTLHYYFKTKENLLAEFIQTLFNRFIYDIERRYNHSDTPERKLEAVFEAGKEFSSGQPKLYTVFVDCWSLAIRNKAMRKMFSDLYEKIAKLIEIILNEGETKGVFNSVREDAVSTFIISLVAGTGLQLHMRQKSFYPKDHFDHATDYFRKLILKRKSTQ